METQLYPTHHFKEQLLERFGPECVHIPMDSFEWVTSTSPNRFDYPKLNRKIQKQENSIRFMVSSEYNMVIPVSETGSLITALYYKGRPIKQKNNNNNN